MAKHLEILALVSMAVLLSCSFVGEEPPESLFGPAPVERKLLDTTDPDVVVHWLVYAYENLSIGLYGRMLDDSYHFVFTAEDAELVNWPWLNKAVDVDATENLFQYPELLKVEMDLPRVSNWQACSDSLSGRDGLCARFEPTIKVTIDRYEFEPLTYWVFSTWLDITVCTDDPVDGVWRVLVVKEILKDASAVAATDHSPDGLSGGLAATEASTWGGIKMRFH